MKKYSLLVVSIALIGLIFLGVRAVQAQDITPPDRNPQEGPRGPFGPGHQNPDRGQGLLHKYMPSALAAEFNLTLDEIESIHDNSITLWDYVQDQGLTWDAFHAKMDAARQSAIQEAAAEGDITPEQAQWMLEHMRGAGKRNLRSTDGSCQPRGSMGGGRFGRGGSRR